MTIMCDGNVTCGVDDAHGLRSFGNVNDSALAEIFIGAAAQERRAKLLSGIPCEGCALFRPVAEAHDPTISPRSPITRDLSQELTVSAPLPEHLIIEPTVRCNLRCNNPACLINNDPRQKTRKCSFLPLATFKKAIDEVGSGLWYLYLFNFGESFLNPRAPEMLAYARKASPGLHITASTNGLMLADRERARRTMASEINVLTVTIAGVDAASYQKYHGRDEFAAAMQGLRNVLEFRTKGGPGHQLIFWTYLLFNWNDSDEQINRAKQLAAELGVDKLLFYLTDIPQGASSLLRQPGQPGHALISDSVGYELSYHKSAPAPGAKGLDESRQPGAPRSVLAGDKKYQLMKRGRLSQIVKSIISRIVG
jgi:hypothetical protein